jgi:hypothetical protein
VSKTKNQETQDFQRLVLGAGIGKEENLGCQECEHRHAMAERGETGSWQPPLGSNFAPMTTFYGFTWFSDYCTNYGSVWCEGGWDDGWLSWLSDRMPRMACDWGFWGLVGTGEDIVGEGADSISFTEDECTCIVSRIREGYRSQVVL